MTTTVFGIEYTTAAAALARIADSNTALHPGIDWSSRP